MFKLITSTQLLCSASFGIEGQINLPGGPRVKMSCCPPVNPQLINHTVHFLQYFCEYYQICCVVLCAVVWHFETQNCRNIHHVSTASAYKVKFPQLDVDTGP